MAVGIISAIPEEYTKLVWDSKPRTETIVNKIFKFGKMDGIDVIAAESGIGKVNAALTTGLLLGHFGCESIAFSGVAGGLHKECSPGDILIADELIQHDYGAIVNGQLISSIPGSFPSLEDTDDAIAYVMPERLKNSITNVVDNDGIIINQTCKEALISLDQYQWDPNPNLLKEKPKHNMASHMADAMRYALYTFETSATTF